MSKPALILLFAILVSACASPGADGNQSAARSGAASMPPDPAIGLADVLAAQPADMRARYGYRHPQQTLEFFGIEPGMTVVEALPGAGWYSKILVNYLGPDGHLIGADYSLDMWPLFGFFPAEFIEGKKTWTKDWPSDAQQWRDVNSAPVSAFVFGSLPRELEGRADAVLFIRALHNLSRFESTGGFLTAAIADAYKGLKPGGIVGVVQHQAPDGMTDEWADGSSGYLNKEALIKRFEQAGFEYVGSTDINANPKDQPTEADVVWRLPPTYLTSKDDAGLKAEMDAIGESNRMTLKFVKR